MRRLHFLAWDLQDSAREMTPEKQAERRRIDQQLLPPVAGGLYCKGLSVLATKSSS